MSIEIIDRRLKNIEQMLAKPTVFQEELVALQGRWQAMDRSDYVPAASDLAQLIQETSRLELFFASGHEQDRTLWEEINAKACPLWKNIEALPVSSKKQEKASDIMMDEVEPSAHKRLVINARSEAKVMVERALDRALEAGWNVDLAFNDDMFRTLLATHCSDEQLDGIAQYSHDFFHDTDQCVHMLSAFPASMRSLLNNEQFGRLQNGLNELRSRSAGELSKTNPIRWILTEIPNREQAQLDGIDYADYLDLFFSSADQPWSEIERAQDILIKRGFDKGSTLRFTNNDGTNLTMQLKQTEGREFANSVMARNLPGSEIFSSPIKESVNGTLKAKGKFFHPMVDGVIEDITFEFKNGRIIDCDARVGKEHLQKIISKDDGLDPDDPQFEGARHVGEIGIGTNPFLTQHLVNIMLVEKISGSFHVAIGRSIEGLYMGEEVALDNGNRSKNEFHWDITTMLKGKEGEIWLDDHLMQKDGVWQAVPELGIEEKDVAVLNKGWLALKEAGKAIPKYWEDKYAQTAPIQAR